MIDADTLASPALFTLFAAVPACCVLAGLGRRGVVAALALFGVLVAVNFGIAFNVSEYGELGVVFITVTGFIALAMMLISWRIGVYIREQRSSPGKR